MDDCRRQRHALLYSQRQLGRQPVCHAGQVEPFQHRVHPGGDFFWLHVIELGVQLNVLAYCQFIVEREQLGHVPEIFLVSGDSLSIGFQTVCHSFGHAANLSAFASSWFSAPFEPRKPNISPR